LIAAEVHDLREDWMPYADEVLADEQLVMITHAALAKRRPKSRSRGRPGTPAEVVLRLLTLKNVKRRRSAWMALHWSAAAMQEAAKGFRRLKAHKQLPALRAALAARKNQTSHGVLAYQSNAA
jgi:hypothetical protein